MAKRKAIKPYGLLKAIQPSEASIQASVVQHLLIRSDPSVYWFHVPNGELRSAATGAKLKKMGVKAGVPDLAFVIRGRAHFLELKRTKGRMSAAQQLNKEIIESSGAVWAIAYGLDDALAILLRWGVFMSSRLQTKERMAA